MISPTIIIICKLIIEMFLFSIIGWLIEVTLKYIQFHHFINRGFLIGPYCPIYGCGVVAVTVLVGGLIGYEGTYGEVFLAGMIICGGLEYFISWYMEVMFHARWWDYSHKPMNLNGRIWIGNLVLFGLASVAIIKFIDPAFFHLLKGWPDGSVIYIATTILLLLIGDNIASHLLMNLVKDEIDKSQEDDTEEISLRVHELLTNHRLLMRRISQAYPNFQARPKHLTEKLKNARIEAKEANAYLKSEIKVAELELKKSVEEAIEDIERQERMAKAKERVSKARLLVYEKEDRLKSISDKLTYKRNKL